MDNVLLQAVTPIQEISIELIAGAAVTLSSAVIAWYARKIHQDWEGRGDKLDELYQAVFGMENVGTMEGVVQIVEAHDRELETHDERMDSIEDKVEEGKRRREALKQRVDTLKQRVEKRGEET